MNVNEIIERRKYLSNKLLIVDNYIASLKGLEVSKRVSLYSKAINYKFELLSKIRSHTILVDSLNKEALIEINGTEISVYEALHLLNTLKAKMDTFGALIENDPTIDVFSTIEKQDMLFEEYINIYLEVLNSDASTVWES